MDQPDIIFIVLDTQRADRLGAYGYLGRLTGTSISPNLDAFAEQSVLFEQAIAPAQWTIPSHASMFTGLYPTAHQVVQSDRSLGPDRPHLAEVLLETGYRTVGFCNNPLVGVLDNGFKRGFETFYNYGGDFPACQSNPLASLGPPTRYWKHTLSFYAEFHTPSKISLVNLTSPFASL